MIKTKITDCTLIQLPRHTNRSGSLSVVENSGLFPFDLKRVFYIYDIPGGESRGAHAHFTCHEVLIAASGAFDVKLDDGFSTNYIRLDRPYFALHIPPGIWAEELSFSSGAICLVLTSHLFEEEDYCRDYSTFLKLKKG